MNLKITETLKAVQEGIHQDMIRNGWWEKNRNFGETIALMHSELSEALEAYRHGNPPSEHIPEFTGVEEEMADTVIRIMDYCEGEGHRLPEALLAKIAYNKTRGYKHGGKVI